MHKIGLIGLLLLMTIMPIQVQAQTYTLRVPSAAEYVEGITAVALQQNPQNEWQVRNLYYNLTDMVFRRFPNLDEVDYEEILAAYDAMGIGQDGYFWRRGQWVEAIFSAWLQQTEPDFINSTELHFEDFQVGVSPYDFDADDQDEFVLDVMKGNPINRNDCHYQAEYGNYLVIQSSESGYQLIETPLYWEGNGSDAVTNFGEGGQAEFNFEDINADGLPEWLVLIGGETFGGPGMGYQNTGRLYILGWRNNRLIDLAMLGDGSQYPYSVTAYGEDSYGCDTAVPRDVSWEFRNLDDDDAQEILQHQTYLDNWQCIARRTKVIDWNAQQDRYVQIDERRDFPVDSRNCARRQAEEAMWAGNYEQALGHYERAFSLSPYINPDEENPERDESYREQLRNRRITYEQYHIGRMALAYQLTGQAEQARTILQSLSSQEFSYEPVEYFVQALIGAPDTALGACLAAYTSFAEHFQASSYNSYLLGVTQEETYQSYQSYSPARIGCDASTLFKTELQNQQLTAERLPADYLNELGMSTRKLIQGDFNEDGQDEWLVWPESPMNPFFFALDGDHYVVSTPAIDPFNHADEIQLWPLPDESGIAIAYLNQGVERFYPEPWACVYDSICGMGGGDAECPPDGFLGLTMWRMEGLELIPILEDATVCRTDFAALFPGGEASTEIDGGEIIFPEANRTSPIRYTWDATTQSFVEFSSQMEATLLPTVIPTPEPKYRYFADALDAGDYVEALTMLDESAAANQNYFQENPDALYAYHYQRAFILEALNRPDEALTEYIFIYEADSDSPWGMMAALHLELTEHE
jgi:hypothetical protein